MEAHPLEVPERKQWVIAADLSAIDPLCSEMASWLTDLNLLEERFGLEILTREALNNAILHGCSQDPALQVHCEVETSKDGVSLIITDDGPGFDWHSALEKGMAPVEQDHGRGLTLYHFYADSIEYNESGNSVRLFRRIGSHKGKS